MLCMHACVCEFATDILVSTDQPRIRSNVVSWKIIADISRM